MFIVQAHIVGQEIERAVVGKSLGDGNQTGGIPCRLGLFLENVVLCDEMAGARVERAREKRAENEVLERIKSCVSYKRNVKDDLNKYIPEVNSREWQLVHHYRPNGIEEDLKSAKKGFSQDRVQKEGFESSG